MQTMRMLAVMITFGISGASAGEFTATVKISGAKYDMKVEWTTDGDLSLAMVARAISDPSLLPRLSSKIESIQVTPTRPNEYESVMTLKTWGLRQRLPSDCEQRFEAGVSWQRLCRLRTSDPEGGRFMAEKMETADCRQTPDNVRCELKITGTFKPLAFWGVELMSAKQLAARAKAEALTNQAQIWFFLSQGGFSPEFSKSIFEKSRLRAQIDEFLPAAKEALSNGEDFESVLKTKTP